MTDIRPFKIAIPEARLTDLQQRLANTILASEAPGAGWNAGPTAGFVTGMIDRLRNGFDWRAQEAAINQHPQFITEIDGQTIHFLHVKAGTAGRDAASVAAWLAGFVCRVSRRHCAAHSGRASIWLFPPCPVLIFRGRPREAGWNDGRIAAALLELMSRLGYQRFGVQGGDAGAVIAPAIARAAPDRVIGVHVVAATMGFIPMGPIEPEDIATFTDAEKVRLQRLQQFMAERFRVQCAAIEAGRRPWPTGFRTRRQVSLPGWAICSPALATGPEAIARDKFLTNVLVYWFTGTAASSIRLY